MRRWSTSASRGRPDSTFKTASRSSAFALPGSHSIKLESSRSSRSRVVVARGQPGPVGQDLGRLEAVGRQVRHSRPEAVNIAGCQRQLELGLPHRGIVGPSAQASFEPGRRLGELTGEDRMVRPAQPDAVVVLVGLDSEFFKSSTGRGARSKPQSSLRTSRRVRSAAPRGSNQRAHVVEPSLIPVKADELELQLIAARAARGRPVPASKIASAGEYRPASINSAAMASDGLAKIRARGRNLGPGGHGLVSLAEHELDCCPAARRPRRRWSSARRAVTIAG